MACWIQSVKREEKRYEVLLDKTSQFNSGVLLKGLRAICPVLPVCNCSASCQSHTVLLAFLYFGEQICAITKEAFM